MNSVKVFNTLSKFVERKSSHTDRFIEIDSKKINECIEFVEILYPDVVVVVCGHNSVIYVSKNCEDVIGYSNSHYKSLTLGEAIKLIHPEDIKNFQHCIDRMIEVQGVDYEHYRFALYYRILHPHEGICYIRDEKIAIKTSTDKYVFLSLFKNLTREENFHVVKMTIKRKVRNQFKTLTEFVPKTQELAMSPRELDIVKFIIEGLSEKQIAEQLNISIHTVKTHKQAIFKKNHVKKSTSLINRVSR